MRGRWETWLWVALFCSGALGCEQEGLDNDAGARGTGGDANGAAGATGGAADGVAGLETDGVAGHTTVEVPCSFDAFLDLDGDGWGNTDELVCSDQYPDRWSGLGGDCDDTDPSVQRALFRDADGDGTGTRDELGCFAADD